MGLRNPEIWQFSGVRPLFITKMVTGLRANKIQRVFTKLILTQNATMTPRIKR